MNFMNIYLKKSKNARQQDVWIVACHFARMVKVISGMVSGCPLNNLVPEWNDLFISWKYGTGIQPSSQD